jgi:hypothetical protein
MALRWLQPPVLLLEQTASAQMGATINFFGDVFTATGAITPG